MGKRCSSALSHVIVLITSSCEYDRVKLCASWCICYTYIIHAKDPHSAAAAAANVIADCEDVRVDLFAHYASEHGRTATLR